MSLRFILGRAGTGKTTLCMEEIAGRLRQGGGGALIFLVPEQATFHSEKSLLAHAGMDGSIRAQVTSFQRLAWRVLQTTGGGLDPGLNDLGRILILRRVLFKNKKDLQVFGSLADRSGFLENLALMITELKTYRIAPEQLTAVLQEENVLAASRQLQAKFADLQLVYREYTNFIEGRYLDTGDHLDLLAARMNQALFLRDAEIWLDGFHGFTPQEFAVLRELLLVVPRVNLTLTIDPVQLNRRLSETAIFYPPWETYQHMLALSQKINCPLEEKTILDFQGRHRFDRVPELVFLEECLTGPAKIYPGQAQAIGFAAGTNRRAELAGVAREILGLCREKGLRYREIAVLTRDFAAYEKILPTVFQDHNIPFFIDRKRALYYHPLLDLINGALEVAEKGWSYEPVFRYLKTDLAPISRQETDLLENYCLAHGIRGSRWTDGKPWTYLRRMTLGEENELSLEDEAELKRVNKAREKAVKPLLNLQGDLKQAHDAREMAAALFSFLEELAVARKLEYWCMTAETEGRLEEAQLHGQVWRKLLEILDQLVEVMDGQKIDLSEFVLLLSTGLENMKLGLIPPGLDQVLVGSLDRSRHPEVKAVFVIGVNEGVLPARQSNEGLLADDDRAVLAGCDLILAPSGERRAFAEQFLIYTALTQASDYLRLSYPLADEEGKALSPSYLIGRMEQIFTQGRTLRIDLLEPEEGCTEEYIVSPRPVLGYMAATLRQAVEGHDISPLWWQVYNWFVDKEEWTKSLKIMKDGLFPAFEQENLPRPLIDRLYGKRLYTSISRLEKFKACPFAHLLSYGLKLQERKEYKLQAPDLGRFFHSALECFYLRLEEGCLDHTDLTPGKVENLVEEIIDELAPQLQNEILLSTARYRYLTRKLKRIVLRAVAALIEHDRRGTFRPLGFEVAFGPDAKLPGLHFTLTDGTVVSLLGRIDRIDGAQAEDGYYLRVIDYKSGTPSLSLPEIFYGLKLQLMTYLNVILTNAPELIKAEARPGGAFYFRIHDPFILGKGPLPSVTLEKRLLREFKMKGYLLNDPRVIKLMDDHIDGYSDLLPAAVNADGQLYQNQNHCLSLEDFVAVKTHVEKILREAGEEIIAGNVRVQPYNFKGRKPCSSCAYSAVCRFDTAMPGQRFRVLRLRDNKEIWAEIAERGEPNGECNMD